MREEIETAAYIPAKNKTELFESNHIYRTCAYCRVSTDNDAQMSSFALQQEHYKNLVGQHANWNLQHIFADEGISGTSRKNRNEFNDMISRCEKGEFDLIITKAIKWRKDPEKTQYSRIECTLFGKKIYSAWSLDEKYSYKTIGKLVQCDRKVMLLFDFSKKEAWQGPRIIKEKA